MKKIVTVLVIQLCFTALANGQRTKSIFAFGDVSLTINIFKNPNGNDLEFEMTTKGVSDQSIYMGSFKPRISWALDSSIIHVYWGEDLKFWRESQYGLSELQSNVEIKTITSLPDPHKDNLIVIFEGQYIRSSPQKNGKVLNNTDLQDFNKFKTFQLVFHAIIDRSESIDDFTN
jgi:hypothetical protein